MAKYLDENQAIEKIKEGQCVALPTETVYGLACDALNESAVRNTFSVKGRPPENPVICHVSSPAMAFQYGRRSDLAERLMEKYWPGPLTILLEHEGKIPGVVTAGSDLCGFRMPDHAITLAIIERCGVPLAIPSANKSGKTSPTTPGMVLAQLEGVIPGVVDGGQCGVGLESTVVQILEDKVKILRPGIIDEARLRADGFQVMHEQEGENGDVLSVPNAKASAEKEENAKSRPSGNSTAVLSPEAPLHSPGLLPVHYQPEVDLFLVQSELLGELSPGFPHASYETIAVLNLSSEPLKLSDILPRRLCETAVLRNRTDQQDASRNLYLDLYELSRNCDALMVIAGNRCSEVMLDRLQRAATGIYRQGKWQFRRS